LMIFIDMPVDSVLTRMIKERGYDEGEVKNKREEVLKLRSNYLEVISSLREQGKKIEVVESDSMEVIHRNCVKFAHDISTRIDV
jgi:thymidylate kinase